MRTQLLAALAVAAAAFLGACDGKQAEAVLTVSPGQNVEPGTPLTFDAAGSTYTEIEWSLNGNDETGCKGKEQCELTITDYGLHNVGVTVRYVPEATGGVQQSASKDSETLEITVADAAKQTAEVVEEVVDIDCSPILNSETVQNTVKSWTYNISRGTYRFRLRDEVRISSLNSENLDNLSLQILFENKDNTTVTCTYAGQESANRFNFSSCTNGAQPDDRVSVDKRYTYTVIGTTTTVTETINPQCL